MQSTEFEALSRKELNELTLLVSEYERQDQESELIEFSGTDPLRNVIRAVAAKLRSERGLEPDESLSQADQIVRSAENEIKKPIAKSRICSALKTLSGDSLALLPVLLELANSGIITVAFDPTGTFLISAACLVSLRLGIGVLCPE